MSKRLIRETAHSLIEKYETNDPFELADHLGIYVFKKDLGKNILGFRSLLNRASIILLNSRNTEEDEYPVFIHELGHHCCGHKNNADKLTKDNMRFIAQGDEFEANFFMVSFLTYGANLAEYPTKENFLNNHGIPKWAERYVDWKYLEETADFNSYDSYY